jgi:multidrug efflux system membrane fusion protein
MRFSFAPRSRPPIQATAFSLAVLVLALGLAGCGQNASEGAAGRSGGGGRGGRGGGGGPAPVFVTQVQRKIVPVLIDAIGSVEPMRTTAVRSQVTGVLQKIAIQEGQDVKEGDLLFQIDPRPFQNALQSAKADREKLRVQLENARAQVARYRTLNAESMVSREQFQQIQDNARALEAQALASDSAVANATLQLEYCSIRAPLAGRTGNLGVHEGDLVRASDSGTPLVTINQISPIYVTFGVPQQYLAAINRYRTERPLPVAVKPPDTEEAPEKGELTFVDNTVDSTTGTIKLKGTFANAAHRLWPGQFATVTVTLSTPEVTVVPVGAVQNSQTGQHVFVVNGDNIAEVRDIVVERTFNDEAVVTKGLNPGETIVVDGQLRVVPGRAVQIRQPDAPATAGAPPHGGGGTREGGRGKGKAKQT